MTWPLRPSVDEHRANNPGSPATFGPNQNASSHALLGTGQGLGTGAGPGLGTGPGPGPGTGPRTGVRAGSGPGTGTTFIQQIPAPVVVPERKKGVRFVIAEDEDETTHENSDDNDENADLDEEAYEDSDNMVSRPESEADEEVMRNPEAIQLGLHDLDLNDSPVDDKSDPIEEYYDNDGENEDAEEQNGASNKDQERLDRFMQPTSHSDEGVLELNRERIDWQSMLQSVLTGEVFSIENKRLEDPSFELKPAIKQQIWQGLRATLHSRPVGDEKRFVETARTQVDGYLDEVMNFKVDPNNTLSPLDQVLDVLHKVDIVESLYPKLSAVGDDKPLYKTAQFQDRLNALNAYASVMKKMKIQTKILRNWTGSETLEVSRSKDASQDEVSFVDKLLKENGLERTFEKSTLSSLHQAMKQIKETMIENSMAFASMGLVPTMSELQQLIRFPTTLMQECLRLRLEYADRVTVPTLLNVDQMLDDFKTSLFLACRIKYEYEELERSDRVGWYLEPCIDSEYEKVLKSSLQFYFKLLSWKVEYWGQFQKSADSVLDLEWENLSELGQSIDGVGLDTAIQLCFLTSKSTAFLYKHLQEQMKERPELPQSAGEVTKIYGKVLENVRFRANRLRRFARTLTDTLENAAEYQLDKKKGDGFGTLMHRLAETNHVMVLTNTIENMGIYMIVERKVAENALYLAHTLRSCFEQTGTGYILILTPRERFVWSGPYLHLDGLPGFDLDVKPGRVRLISERGSLLDSCKKRFSKFAEPCGLEIITESRANVTALNKELNKTKKAAYKLADTIVQAVAVLRKVTAKVPNCQDLVQPFFRFASDYGLTSLSSMEGLPRSQFNLKLLRLSIDWVSFVCDNCDQTDRQTFRWAMAALNFAMKMTKGNNILALSDSEFSWLRSKIAGCMTLLISHFDIHGARTQTEAIRNERDGRQKQGPKDQTRLLEEISNILKLATANESVLSEEAARNHRQQVEKLANLEKMRTEREQEIKVIGKVLDDQKPEDRSLVFLAALTDSVAIRWQMAKYIGSGTFGTVYLGTNSDTGELIAVKEIRFQNASMSLVKSIRDEMKVMKMMHHPNIVRYDNIEVHRHKVFIFMEYCQGGSLADLLEHGRIEDEKVIKFYTLQMLKGLAYLHDKNVVHRDIKPDNVLLDHLGNIKYVDFGAAKILAKNQRTRTHGRSIAESISVGVGANSLNGTPMYMAPEVIKNGEKGRKGSMDIWSLGCCVLEMATGRRPWAHLDNEWAVMYHVATSHPPLPDPSQMSAKGIAFLKRCFTRSSRERPSAVELLRDEWLKGVDTDDNREEYAYEEPPIEVNSDGEAITPARYGEDDEELMDYPDTEHSLSSYNDHSMSSYNGNSLSSLNGHISTAEEEEEEEEERKDSVKNRDSTKDEEMNVEQSKDTTIPQTLESQEQAPAGITDEMNPTNYDIVISDSASEVGSEVDMILSAVQKREEFTRNASKQSSPMLDHTSPDASLSTHLSNSGITDGGLETTCPENGNQNLRPKTNIQISTSILSPIPSIAGSEEHSEFAREMGLDLYDTNRLERSRQMSPILSLGMTNGGCIHHNGSDSTAVEPDKNATERYTETLNSALSYFSSLAQSSAGWKRLSSASVRPKSSISRSSSSGGKGGGSSLSSSPISSRHSHHDDIMANLPGPIPSSAASAAIESLLPSISVSKKSVPGKSAEIVRASITLPGLNEQTDLEDWRAVLECTGARKICMCAFTRPLYVICHFYFDPFRGSDGREFDRTDDFGRLHIPRDALLIETTLLDHNAVLHIATSIKPSEDDPIFLRPSPPHVRAYLPLVVWHIQLVPADLDDTVSFTSFGSLSASQNKPVMPRHSIRVSFYYQIDMRGWAVNSSVSMQSHVPSCIANVYRLLRRQGVPPHVSRHSPRIQLDLNDYDPATGIYELRYDVIPADSEDLLTGRRTVSSALRQFHLESSLAEGGSEIVKDSNDSSNIPQEHVLSDDDEVEDIDNELSNEASQNGYVDVELDGEKWGMGSDIVVHIFMNDIEDEEFVQENVECLKYMGRNRYILRMKHSNLGSHQGAINVKLRIERIPQQQTSGNANLLSHQQHVLQRQQLQEQQQPQLSDVGELVVSVNGYEKNILPFRRSPVQNVKRVGMSLQEQFELSKQIVQEVDDGPNHWRPGSDGAEGQDGRTGISPLLLMSSSMSATMQSIGRSNQSVLSNGTSTMTPGNTNPSKVNNSYIYFNSLLQEPTTSWKAISKQRGVQISKLEAQGHAPGIVRGEGVFENYTIWDIKAALDCASARKIWDKMFDESHMLQQATPSSTLSYLRLKGFWPTSPKDMAVLNTTFITKDAIHYFATSVDDTNLYPSIPPPQSPFVRSELVVSGWYLETVKPQSVRIAYIAQAAPTSWMVPGTALGAMTTEMPLCIAEVVKYLEVYGSPPTLVSIRRGRALGVDYSHSKSSFRLEYVQDSNPIFSGQRASLQQQVHSVDRQRRSAADVGAGTGSPESSPKLGPTDKLLAEIRLDARSWAKNGDCEITIDPPPSKVVCSCVPHDGTGYRLRIEHSSGRAVPAGGKVLLMARKPAVPGCGLVINGVPIKTPPMEHLETWAHHKAQSSDKDKALTLSIVDGALSEKENQEDDDEDGIRSKSNTKDSSVPLPSENSKASSTETLENTSDKRRSPASLMTPLEYAQGAMDLLTRIKADPEDSWSVVSDSKGGLRVTKRFMPEDISDQVPLVRGEKVIEGFSLEEIATVIGTLGTRPKLDDLFESGEMLQSFGAGCAIFHHVLKSYFPLPLPARDLYFVTVTASAEASARCPQIIILSTSIPHEIIPTPSVVSTETSPSSGTPASKTSQPRPRAHLHLSAWILEGIDPYSSSHPIPSTRVTYMTALDLGGSVPQRISGLLQTTFPKMITHVESYLQYQAAPPIVRIPEQLVTGTASDVVSIDERLDENTFVLPSVWPWNKPASKMLSWDFSLKDSFCEITLLFDQFRLYSSRLDLAIERRIRRNKKLRRKSRGARDSSSVDINVPEELSNLAGDVANEKNKNRTVLELVVDLKQYPLGYNITTNIKVDPEFLLQHKQQRDSGLKQHQLMMSSASSLKLSGSTPSTNVASTGGNKFIGGFDNSGQSNGSVMDSGNRRSVDALSASEAASSGTGIAAVLGSSANLPRSLPSSTSLIRILPPSISVNVIDIPPAPSHSSSLSGISKRRKHLIIITVPEAERSLSHVHAQQQAAAASQVPKNAAPHIISGAAAKPVITTNSASGTTSTMFSMDDVHNMASGSSLYDSDSVVETTKPPHSAGRSPTTSESNSKLPIQPTPTSSDHETRMFQFDVKIDRLEQKDLVGQATRDPNHTTENEKEWPGMVMVNGQPVKVLMGWSRQDLGFLDGMMEEEEECPEQQQQQQHQHRSQGGSSSTLKSPQYNSRGSKGQDSDLDDGESRNPEDGDMGGEGSISPNVVTRRKKHRQQQIDNLGEYQESQTSSPRDRVAVGSAGESSQKARTDTATNDRPTGSMYGLSDFLMNVGLLGNSSKSRKRSNKTAESSGDTLGNGASSREHEDSDDDSTIRASKGVSRGRLSGILGNNGNKSHGYSDDHDHDLDLESLHGSIVFKGQRGMNGDDSYDDDEISDWARQSGSVRRRETGEDISQSDENERRSSQDLTAGIADSTANGQLRHRRHGSRSSFTHQQHRSRNDRSSIGRRHGSTNGADHPRFRGSKLYAYSFRNLFWSAVFCFLVGLLLRIYVIGPSYTKTVSPSGGSGSGPATYYYYYHVAPKKPSAPFASSTSSPLLKGEDAAQSSVWPQGIREVFTVRRILGWDFVLLAYPSHDQQQK
ncbi:Suppressor of Sensor Kinase (SLN1) [Mortierella sp. AD011]|nr:Suppressor of Sensor Kinase (SLN1) [Mortierella sp. AD011]